MEYRISTNILSTCIIWLQIWNLHTRVTLDLSFPSNTTFSSWVMAIVIFVPLVPLMTQVAETHIDTWIWSKVHSNNFLSLLVKKFSIYNTVWNDFDVKICVSATWSISGTSGTNMTMAITQLEKVLLLRKLKSRVTRVWRFQICNQIIKLIIYLLISGIP